MTSINPEGPLGIYLCDVTLPTVHGRQTGSAST